MKVEGVEGFRRRLAAISDTRGLMRAMQIETVDQAKRLVPYKTGELHKSIGPDSYGEDRARVVAAKSYAAAVEYGTKAHDIVPRRARSLAWPANTADRRLSGRPRTSGGKPTGPFIFARKVRHPGSRAKPYLVPGAKAAVEKSGIPFFYDAWNEAD